MKLSKWRARYQHECYGCIKFINYATSFCLSPSMTRRQ